MGYLYLTWARVFSSIPLYPGGVIPYNTPPGFFPSRGYPSVPFLFGPFGGSRTPLWPFISVLSPWAPFGTGDPCFQTLEGLITWGVGPLAGFVRCRPLFGDRKCV